MFVFAEDLPAVYVSWGHASRLAGDATGADERYQTVLSRWGDSDQAAGALHGQLQLAGQAGDQQKIDALSAEFLKRFGVGEGNGVVDEYIH